MPPNGRSRSTISNPMFAGNLSGSEDEDEAEAAEPEGAEQASTPRGRAGGRVWMQLEGEMVQAPEGKARAAVLEADRAAAAGEVARLETQAAEAGSVE